MDPIAAAVWNAIDSGSDDASALGDAIGHAVAESICHAHVDAHGFLCPDCDPVAKRCSQCVALALDRYSQSDAEWNALLHADDDPTADTRY